MCSAVISDLLFANRQKKTKEPREYRLEACKGTLPWASIEGKCDRKVLAAKQSIIDNNQEAVGGGDRTEPC
jgi:hypothetical protein